MSFEEDRSTREHLLGLERKRCDALASGDFVTLGQLLSRDLLHVHTRGNTDGFDSYLEYMRSTLELLKVERGELRVRLYGKAATMDGVQINTARLRQGTGEVMQITSRALQVWAKEPDGQWRMTQFQATALGPPTPVVSE